MNEKEFLQNLWRWKCGLPEISSTDGKAGALNDLYESEWSSEFETYMRNRLVLGALRYGKLNDSEKPKYDRVSSAKKRLEMYERNGNLEHLVDVANLMLVEFVDGKHLNKHFCAVDDGIHVEII